MIDSLAAGGAERILVELVNGLHKRCIPVGVCVTRSGKQLASDLAPEIELIELNRTRTWDLSAIRTLNEYCERNAVEILHAHGRGSMKFCALAKLLGSHSVRLLFHDHFGKIAIDQSASFYLKAIARTFIDSYVGVSIDLQRWAIQRLGIAPERTAVLGNAIDLRRFESVEPLKRSELGTIKQPLIAITVANLKAEKNHHLIFRSLAECEELRRNVHVLVVGLDLQDEYSRKCRRTVNEFGLRENVSFLGTRDDIPRLLRTADFGLLASVSESGPVTLLEYMASALPFLATQTGQIAEAVAAQGLQFFVSRQDLKGFAAAFRLLATMNANERLALGAQGLETVRCLFDIKKQVTQLLGIYRQLGVDLVTN